MKEILGLLKRDVYLLYNIGRKRLIIYFGSILLLNLTFSVFGGAGALIEIRGVTVREFMESMKFPYYTVWQLIGAVIVGMDFVRNDLYEHGSNLIVKLRSKRNYWISKLLMAFIMCALISILVMTAEYIVDFKLFGAEIEKWYDFGIKILLMNTLYSFMGSYVVYCLYALFGIAISEIPSLILCMVCICLGLPTNNKLFILNNYMLSRLKEISHEGSGTFNFSVIYLIVTVGVVLVAGTIIINRVEIYKRSGDI